MKGYDTKLDEKTLSDTYYENFHFLLGKIIVNYNMIESNMIMMICNLIDINDITKGFLECKFKGATEILKILTKHINRNVKNRDKLNSYKLLSSDIKEIIEQRNTFMHSIYIDPLEKRIELNKNIRMVRRIRIREFEKGKTEIMTQIIYNLNSFQGLLQWILNVQKEIESFFELLGTEVPTKDIYICAKELPTDFNNL